MQAIFLMLCKKVFSNYNFASIYQFIKTFNETIMFLSEFFCQITYCLKTKNTPKYV